MRAVIERQTTVPSFGKLAKEYCGVRLPLQVCQSNAGHYIGTYDDEGPCSRESAEYFQTQEEAQQALDSGDWTQRERP